MPAPESLENFSRESLEESTRLLRTLLNSPDTRESTLRLIKKKTGGPIAEIDAKDAVLAEVATERSERLKLEAQIREDKILGRLEKERAKAQQENNLSNDEMLAVEKMMVDPDENARIPSYGAAAKVLRASKQLAQPTTHQLKPHTWDMPEKDVWAAGIGNKQALNKIALEEAYKASNEFRLGVAK